MSSKAQSQRDQKSSPSTCFHCSPPPFRKIKMAPLLLMKPCKGLSRLIRNPFRRPVTVRILRFSKREPGKSSCWPRPSSSSFRSFHRLSLCRSRQGEDLDKLGELRSMTERERVRAPFPSPITPAYVKYASLRRRRQPGGESFDEVEEACRSFENYLVEMIVEDGKVRDLMDVEELLCSWDSLKSPVFVGLVCRFYGELCNDLFSGSERYELIEDEALL